LPENQDLNDKSWCRRVEGSEEAWLWKGYLVNSGLRPCNGHGWLINAKERDDKVPQATDNQTHQHKHLASFHSQTERL